MNLKYAMLKALEYAIDNSKDDYDDIAEVSFNVYITKKTFI